MSKRLFVGIRVPVYLHADLARLQTGLAGARWVNPGSFHITLKFLGDVVEPVLPEISLALSKVKTIAPVISLGALGYFGKRTPSALYVGVNDTEDLMGLAGKVKSCLEPFVAKSESRKYTPHLTLAYLKAANEHQVMKMIAANSPRPGLAFTPPEFELIESHLGGQGPTYQTLSLYPFER